MRTFEALVALAFGMIVLAFACGGGTLGKIQTSDGEYSITRAEWEGGRPIVPGAIGWSFVVSFRRDSEREGVPFNFCPQEGGQVYITASDGSKAPCIRWDISMTFDEAGHPEFDDQFDLIFTPTAPGPFTLFVPDNPPINLGR